MESELAHFLTLLTGEWQNDLVSAVLFGSRATGTAGPASDIDLLLVHKNPPRARLARHALVFKLAQRISESFAERLSAILLTPTEARITKPYYLDMTVNCHILIDHGGFFQDLLTALRRRLEALGSKRVFDTDGRPYWILKENAKPGEEIVL